MGWSQTNDIPFERGVGFLFSFSYTCYPVDKLVWARFVLMVVLIVFKSEFGIFGQINGCKVAAATSAPELSIRYLPCRSQLARFPMVCMRFSVPVFFDCFKFFLVPWPFDWFFSKWKMWRKHGGWTAWNEPILELVTFFAEQLIHVALVECIQLHNACVKQIAMKHVSFSQRAIMRQCICYTDAHCTLFFWTETFPGEKNHPSQTLAALSIGGCIFLWYVWGTMWCGSKWNNILFEKSNEKCGLNCGSSAAFQGILAPHDRIMSQGLGGVKHKLFCSTSVMVWLARRNSTQLRSKWMFLKIGAPSNHPVY